MNRLFAPLFVLLCVWSSISFGDPSAQPHDPRFNQDSISGMEIYDPIEFFYAMKNPAILQSYFPEMTSINANQHEDLKKMAWSMIHRGVSFSVGQNQNHSNYFNLYGNYIGINPGEPAAIFGYNERAEVGHFHFPTHDAAHLYISQIGVRLKDLKNPEEVRARVINILLKIEGLASTWTSWDHVKRYWDWRNRTIENHDVTQFNKYNSGVYFLGPISRSEFTDFVMSNTVGDFKLNYKTTLNNINYEHYMNRQEAQVPQVLDVRSQISSVFKTILGDEKQAWAASVEKFLFKYAKMPIALGTAINAYFRPATGYKGFLSYANIQANFYLQPWYVEWSDLFKVGDELSVAEKEIDRKIQDFKEGRFAQEVQPPARGIMETMQLKSNVSAFGRKLVELKHLAKKPEAAAIFRAEDIKDIDVMIEKAQALNDKLFVVGKANKPVSIDWVLESQKYHSRLMAVAEKRFPVEKYLPYYLRLPHADYSRFWADPLAVVMPRPAELTAFLSSKGIAQKAREYSLLREKMRAMGQKPHFDTNLVDGSIESTADRLAAEYTIEQLKKAELTKVTNVSADYIEKLRTFHGLLVKQIDDVYLPQVLEAEQLNMSDRKYLYEQIKTFEAVFASRMIRLERLYTEVFVKLNKDAQIKKELFITEANLAISSHVVLTSMWEILNKLNVGKKLVDVKDQSLKISTMREEIRRNDKEVTFNSADYVKILLPTKAHTVKSICSYITRFCLMNQDITDFTKKEAINKNIMIEKTNLVVKGEAGVDFNALPRNAVIILVSNHDFGIVDGRTISKVADSLGIKKSLSVIDPTVYPHFKFRDNKDPNLLPSNEKFYDNAFEQIAKFADGRISINIFPEGVIQYWGSQFPRTAKWGAFAYARRAAAALKGKKEVYIVEINTNGIEYMTTGNQQDLVALVKKPVLVPDHAMSDQDSWTSMMRTQFEKSANASRAVKQIDLIDRGIVNGTNVPRAAAVRSYESPTQYLNELTKGKMDAARILQSTKCSSFFQKAQ